MTKLQDVVSISRRYMRSINLERDLASPEALEGYVPTGKGMDTLQRMARAAITPNSVRAWTVTGAYGTGKSAFALWLAAALAGPARPGGPSLADGPERLISAVAVAGREPLAYVVVRALARGVEAYWAGKKLPACARAVLDAASVIGAGGDVSADAALGLLRALLKESRKGVLLVIDELGKVLEYAAHHPGREDLYLLQRIAELPAGVDEPPVLTLLLLHRSFADYTLPMQAAERSEWAKVQGRFEDVPYAEGPGQMMRLVSRAIEHHDVHGIAEALDDWSATWMGALERKQDPVLALDAATIRGLYPLHPLTALVLPIVCTRYAQNDRSMFSFLTSWEAHGFQWFLAETPWRGRPLATLQPHHLYDYFVETARLAAAARPEFQRWTEVQARVTECRGLPERLVRVVKTVGIFNLVAMLGELRASRALVARALSDAPGDAPQWEAAIDEALERGLVSWRRQADELRVWEGSDFDVEQALVAARATVMESLPELLDRLAPLPPVVARQHSYRTGTLRYFERRYLDDLSALSTLAPKDATCDGILVYWLAELPDPALVPKTHALGGPLVVLGAAETERLCAAVREVVALERLSADTPQLLSDGIARREVGHRLAIARSYLDAELQEACGFGRGVANRVLGATRAKVASVQALNAMLSRLCDEAYPAGPRLWTELLNRRELTTQGAMARRELIAAMLAHAGEPGLALVGYGPEVSMAKSTLEATGLYAEDESGRWRFGPPGPALTGVYEAIEAFVAQAKEAPAAIDLLFERLKRPPYGMKAGPMPVVLAAYMCHHGDAIGFYQDGTFIPQPGAEHFELLVKHPQRFALKSFQLSGARRCACDALASALGSDISSASPVALVRAMMRRARAWPEFTRRTREHAPSEAVAVRDALLSAREPDRLLFEALPAALGRPAISVEARFSAENAEVFASGVVTALDALDDAYAALLRDGYAQLVDAFALPPGIGKLRTAFRERGAGALAQLERGMTGHRHADGALRRFLIAAMDATGEDRSWLEAVLMVAMDRPVETWTDGDARALGSRFLELARRFRTLEAFAGGLDHGEPGVKEPRRLSLARNDGKEVARLVWIDEARRPVLERLVAKALADPALATDAAMQEAFAATLIEQVFGLGREDE